MIARDRGGGYGEAALALPPVSRFDEPQVNQPRETVPQSG